MMGIPLRTALILSNIFIFTCAAVYAYYKLDTILATSKLPEWLRRQFALALVFFLMYMALMPFYPGVMPCFYLSEFFLAGYYHVMRSGGQVLLPVFLVLNIQRALELRNIPLAKQHVIIIGAIFICFVSSTVSMRVWIGNVRGNAFTWSFLFSLFISAMISVLYLSISYTKLAVKRKQFEKELEISKLNELKTRAELETLQAKINPHFLYNTLNSIAELSVSQGQKAREMTIALADLFRYSLNKRSETDITIEQEIEMVENYLLIEKIRFEDKLAVEIDIEPSLRLHSIPKFILQPIVENAIKHGVKDANIQRVIKIIISGDSRQLQIIVRDNGGPFHENINMGYGLKNLSDKMTWAYHGSHHIFYENAPFKQLVIAITNPLKYAAAV
jgi:two-component system LytT family sensor kinase